MINSSKINVEISLFWKYKILRLTKMNKKQKTKRQSANTGN